LFSYAGGFEEHPAFSLRECHDQPRDRFGDGLTLRAAKDEADAQGFIKLSQTVTGEGAICDRMIHHMPGLTWQTI
jgi:hypothetical protein